ncbi:MAG TPA: CHASE domain-containing protein [Propionibacteriaceae bacterium]
MLNISPSRAEVWRIRWFYRLAAVVVVLTGLSGSLAYAQHEETLATGTARERAQVQVDQISARLAVGIGRYERALQAQRAYYAGAGDRVSLTDYQSFVRSLDLSKNYPGMQGMGFLQAIGGDELARVLVEVRRDGRPDFSVTPPGRRAEYMVVRYQEPAAENRQTWGFDVRTIDTVRPFLERARDTGQPTMSGKVARAVDPKVPQDRPPVSFGLFVPIYRAGADIDTVAQRRAAILGWASSAFRAQDFLSTFAGRPAGIGVEVFEGHSAKGSPVAASPLGFQATGDSVISQSLAVGGRTWTLRFAQLTATGAETVQRQVLLIGAALTLLLGALVWVYGLHASQKATLSATLEQSRATVREAEKVAIIAGRDAAVAAWDRQTNFAASAAHELKTPTSSVLGFIEEVLDNDELSVDDRECLDVAYRNAQRLARLIDDLLIVGEADISSSMMELELTPMASLVKAVVSSFSATALRSQVTLSGSWGDEGDRLTCADASTCLAMADPVRLEQALTNLVSNAVKFTPPGGRVDVQLRATDEHVQIVVTDTGIGIDAEAVNNIFDRFYRARQVVDGGIQGTGLGLAIARQMTEAQGGSLSVTSKQGSGSTFTLNLPAAGERAADARRPSVVGS